ncbi:MAG: hypothetical protein KC435_14720 [Thermomicrobiales bacterium]|nr:hypothetical protein [Thermomicrobiales bacterium]
MSLKRPPKDDDLLMDARQPGVFRIVYTIVAIIVVLGLVIGIAGYAWWNWFF